MHLSDCEHPIRVYSKVLGEYVWVRCNKCNSCKRHRANRWIARLEQERSHHQFSAFVTLTYNDQSLPRLELRPVGFGYPINLALRGVQGERYDDICIPFNELDFSTTLDKEYFDKRLELEGSIPFAYFKDIQLYHKRLNKAIHDKVTNKYSNFRFFTVSEYGSTSHRPHFHEILFFDDSKIAESITELVSSAWYHVTPAGTPLCNGFVHVELVEKSANSYVAQYLNELFDLPSFYRHCEIRPRFVCSKRPSIGIGGYSPEDLREIFDGEVVQNVIRDPASRELKVVPLLSCFKNRLFPRLPYFDQIHHSLRVKLYGCAFTEVGLCRTFQAFFEYVYKYFKKSFEVDVQCHDYLMRFDKSFGKVPHAFLRRIYYMSKRVLLFCKLNHLKLEDYVCKIESFYSKCKASALTEFYKFQEEYSKSHNFESLIHCYPEFAYKHYKCDFVRIEQTEDYRNMCLDNKVMQEKATKSHYKNAYIEAKSETINFFKFLIYFYNAKKCNENLQAFSRFG